MIIKPRWRKPGNLAAHLVSTEHNARVEFSRALSLSTTDDLHLELRELVALASAYPRVGRKLLHIIISPGQPLDDSGLEKTIKLIEQMLSIPASTPRIVVKHAKGARAVHAHAVFVAIDPITGFGIRSHLSFARAEAAARAAEHIVGEPLVSSTRNPEVAQILRLNGFEEVADRVEALKPARRGARLNQKTRDVLARENVNADALAADIWAGFCAFEENSSKSLQRHLEERGVSVSQGEKVILAVRSGTDASVPLARTLRTVARARDRVLALDQAKLADMLSGSGGHAIEPQLNARQRVARARQDLGDEYGALAIEASIDGNRSLAAAILAHRKRVMDREDVLRRLRKAKDKIRFYLRKIALVRRLRVRRAFDAARWPRANSKIRHLAMGAATRGVTLAGGGLGLSLLAAGVALAAMPFFEKARAVARAEQRALIRHRTGADQERTDGLSRLRRDFKARRQSTRTATVLPRPDPAPSMASPLILPRPTQVPRLTAKRLQPPPFPFQAVAPPGSAAERSRTKSPEEMGR